MNSRWEGIVVLRKLSIVCFSSFLHDDGLQLQFALGVMVVNLALHHIYLPFEVSGAKKGKYLEEDAESGHFSGQGLLLHRLERNSILVCTLLLWSSTVFTMRMDCSDIKWGFCSFVVLAVFLSNIVFLISSVYLFVFLFLKRTKLMTHVVTVAARVRMSGFGSKRRSRAQQEGKGTRDAAEQLSAMSPMPTNPLYGANWGSEYPVGNGGEAKTSTSSAEKSEQKKSKKTTTSSESEETAIEMVSPTSRPRMSFQRYMSDGGDEYFANMDTGETTWTLPEDGVVLDSETETDQYS